VDKAFIAGAIALSLAILSAVRRLRFGWRWRGASVGRWLMAALSTVLIAYFIGAATQFRFANFQALAPWAFAGIGIGLFSILNILQLVHRTETGFRADCADGAMIDAKSDEPSEPGWKRFLGAVFYVLFLVVWLEGVTAMYVTQSVYSAGTADPNEEMSVAMTEKGRTVYVTAADKHLSDVLMTGMMFGFPSMIAIGAFLQFVLKIRLNPIRTD
jgi:hypothetical protein